MIDKLLLYKALKNKSGAEISASGNPVTLSGTLADNPLKECKIYGWSKQETTKGKNLFDFSRLVSDDVNTMDYDNQTITVPAKTNNTGYNQTLRDLCPGITPGIYVFSMKRSNPESVHGSYFLEAMKDFPINTPIELTDELLDNHIAWYNNPDSDIENVISEIQVEKGTEATDYEPYTGGQPSPSPEYPQEIVSAGSDGKIGIEVRGKNLFDLEYALKQENWNMAPNRYYYIPYYVGKGSTVTVSYDGKPALGLDAYVLIGRKAGETENPYGWLYHSSVQSLVNNTKTFVAEADYIYINGTSDYIKMFREHFKNFQIEVSQSPTAYEPYHEPQSLSIQTPTGLPAIPVNADGNYTDANGQQWVCDEVDLKRGVKVQRVNRLKLDDLSWKHELTQINKNDSFISDVPASQDGTMRGDSLCQYAVFSGVNYDTEMTESSRCYVWTKVITIQFKAASGVNSFDAFSEWLKAHPDAGISYCLAVPIETTLIPEEIQAYKNLVTYAGTTIVENDAECYMEVSAGGGDVLRAKKLALILGD